MTKFISFNAISNYALLTLFSVSLANAIGAELGAELNDSNPGYAYFKEFSALKKHDFTLIEWIGGAYGVSLGDVEWRGERRFLKCSQTSLTLRENVVFDVRIQNVY
ncbi:hypothetical protein BDF19DRAFT_444884 [Syncephalis fuscata]|nr:hypothetical protein BDF19DRAFT_444884 [Syncephalis fuscata]